MRYLFALIAAAIAFAAPAHADPDGDYVNTVLSQPGMAGGIINTTLYTMLGHQSCDAMHSGATPEDAQHRLLSPWVTPYIARVIVTSAQGTLC